jgi:NAD(P)H dehydrogenase (quinone)
MEPPLQALTINRYPNTIRQLSSTMEDILGLHQRALADGGPLGKYAGLFVSSGTQGGGQESTNLAAMSTLAHHGLIYVPLGTKTAGHLLMSFDEVRGGSAWGAGTFSGPKGDRQPTDKELEIATIQGESFWNALAKVKSEV